ncbi:cell surface glycoprotein (s-layer protein)-like protein [Anaeramoeba flamelloides]|uniref:Cell surface glycoprotein (S-layer protein)-like protein n=1 Tax=Anaeramoeba flamelloides TaxID=1746091 RepID=A0AAV8A6V2_9EUKA|nr:cell surface glycoprotein (s-layer protein)-like protein [Anaeramoeba flamelloides]
MTTHNDKQQKLEGSFFTKIDNDTILGYSTNLGTMYFRDSDEIYFLLGSDDGNKNFEEIQLVVVGCQKTKVQPEKEMDSQTTFFQGQKKQRSQNYQRLRYQNIYPNTDLVFNSIGSTFKSEFYLYGNDHEQSISEIKFNYISKSTIYKSINENGELIIKDKNMNVLLIESAPVVSQNNQILQSNYFIDLDGNIQIQINPEKLIPNIPLIIDPTYSTYLGLDNSSSFASDLIVLDDQSVVFLGGASLYGFPSDTKIGGCSSKSIIIVKFSSDGKKIIWSTIVGSDYEDIPHSITKDNERNFLVSGITLDVGTFPTTTDTYFNNCFDTNSVGSFFFRLNGNGEEILQSTIICSIAESLILVSSHIVDQNDNIYISSIFAGQFQNCVSTDHRSLLLLKLSDDFKKLIDYNCTVPVTTVALSRNLQIDPHDDLIVVGYSDNTDLEDYFYDRENVYLNKHRKQTNSEQIFNQNKSKNKNSNRNSKSKSKSNSNSNSNRNRNRNIKEKSSCFIAKFDKENFEMKWIKYVGTNEENICFDFDLDSNGDIYVVGSTPSQTFPVTDDAWIKTTGFATAGFFLKYLNDGSEMVYSTFIRSYSTKSWNTAESIHISSDSKFVYICGRSSLEQLWWVLTQIYSSDQYWDYCVIFETAKLASMNTTLSFKFEEQVDFAIAAGWDSDTNVPTIYVVGSSQNIVTTEGAFKPTTKIDNAFITHIDGCAVGYYGNNSFDCNECPLGYISTAVDQTKCSACPKGTYSTYGIWTKVRQCEPCVIGDFNNYTAQINCYKCFPGTYSNKIGTVNCNPCDKGEYSIGFGSTKCKKCLKSTYSSEVGQTGCLNCSKKLISSNDGSSSCYKCMFFTKPNEKQDKCIIVPKRIYVILFPVLALIIIFAIVFWRLSIRKKNKQLVIRITNVDEKQSSGILSNDISSSLSEDFFDESDSKSNDLNSDEQSSNDSYENNDNQQNYIENSLSIRQKDYLNTNQNESHFMNEEQNDNENFQKNDIVEQNNDEQNENGSYQNDDIVDQKNDTNDVDENN